MEKIVFGSSTWGRAFSSKDNAWTVQTQLEGDCILKLRLSKRGRVAIRKSNTGGSPWPVVLMSPPTEDAEIYIYGETKGKHIRIQTAEQPTLCELYGV